MLRAGVVAMGDSAKSGWEQHVQSAILLHLHDHGSSEVQCRRINTSFGDSYPHS